MNMQMICHGVRRDHELIQSMLREYDIVAHYTTHHRHGRELTIALPASTDLIIVAGGDGTLHEVVDGLMQRPKEMRPPILLLPIGSGNDAARMIGAKATIADVQRRLSAVNHLEWDVFECAVGNDRHTRYCTNVLDVGFGGNVAQQFNSTFRKLPARIGYMAATIWAFVSARAQEVTIATDDAEITAPMLMAAVANGKWFGSGIGIAPHASPHDGIADLTLITNVGVLTYLRFLPQLIRGVPIMDMRIQYLRSTRISVTASQPLPIEIDGEFAGYTPLCVHVHHQAVRLLV